MTLRKRLTRLELTRPADGAAVNLSHLAPGTLQAMAKAYAEALTSPGPYWCDGTFAGLLARIEKMQADGMGPEHLADGELELLVAARDMARGQA